MTSGAGDGARTRDLELGKLRLYQLSYARPEVALDFTTASRLLKILHRDPLESLPARIGEHRGDAHRHGLALREEATARVSPGVDVLGCRGVRGNRQIERSRSAQRVRARPLGLQVEAPQGDRLIRRIRDRELVLQAYRPAEVIQVRTEPLLRDRDLHVRSSRLLTRCTGREKDKNESNSSHGLRCVQKLRARQNAMTCARPSVKNASPPAFLPRCGPVTVTMPSSCAPALRNPDAMNSRSTSTRGSIRCVMRYGFATNFTPMS